MWYFCIDTFPFVLQSWFLWQDPSETCRYDICSWNVKRKARYGPLLANHSQPPILNWLRPASTLKPSDEPSNQESGKLPYESSKTARFCKSETWKIEKKKQKTDNRTTATRKAGVENSIWIKKRFHYEKFLSWYNDDFSIDQSFHPSFYWFLYRPPIIRRGQTILLLNSGWCHPHAPHQAAQFSPEPWALDWPIIMTVIMGVSQKLEW